MLKRIMTLTTYPFSLLEDISSLNRSPALRCANLKVSAIFTHWVPFPLPGPPGTRKITSASYEVWLEFP